MLVGHLPKRLAYLRRTWPKLALIHLRGMVKVTYLSCESPVPIAIGNSTFPLTLRPYK